MLRIRNPKNLGAGILFVAFGVAAFILAQSYPIGSASRMGPGYFPRLLGAALVVLGLVLATTGLRGDREASPTWQLRPLAMLIIGIIAFTLLTPRLGLVIGGLVLVLTASFASPEFRWKEALLSGVIQAALASAIFVYGLGIPLPIWPKFIAAG